MSFKLKNTKRYLKEYTESLLNISVQELNRKDRVRNYNSQSITSSITASGSLQESLEITEKDTDKILQLNLKGNSYAEQIDEGTNSATPPVSKN